MRFIHQLKAMRRNLLQRSRIDSEDDAEVRAYVELLTDELVASGMSPAEAARSARAACGGIEQVKQAVRNVRAGMRLELLWQDVRFGVRQFCRKPLFTVAALFSLALGMGATTAIFTAVNALLLRPLPFEDPDQLVCFPSLAPDYNAIRMDVHAFERIGGFVARSDANLTDLRDPYRATRVAVTASFFATLGVYPQLGRDIAENEDLRDGPPVVMISDRLWRNQYDADPAVIGRSITLNGDRHTVIGVLPPGFVFPDPSIEPDIYAPAALPRTTERNGPAPGVMTIARLKHGVSRARAQAEAGAFFERRSRLYPMEIWSRQKIWVEPLQRHVTGDTRRPLLLLLACVICVLLVTCANVANLQLARAASRSHETAVREALGATRARLVRQFLVENLVLSAAASLLGFAAVWLSMSLIQGARPFAGQQMGNAGGAPLPNAFLGKYGSSIHVDGSILLFSMALAIITTILFGAAPAIHVASRRSFSRLQANAGRITSGFSHQRFRKTLLVLEVAMSIALLSCAGLLIRSFANVMSYRSGFDPSHTLTAMIRLAGSGYQQSSSAELFVEDLLPRLRALPGVESAALTSTLPLGTTFDVRFSLDGDSNPPFDRGHLVASIIVSPDYFRAVSTRIIRGRSFNADDREASARVLMVNHNLASRFFAGNALGRQMFVRDLESTQPRFVPATIVGVVEDVPHNGLLQQIEPEVYLPISQTPAWEMQIVMRSTADPRLLSAGLTRAVAATDRDVPVADVETMEERVDAAIARRKAIMALMTAFAGLAIVLSAVGVFGVFAYTVSQRTREMGIRMALGASRATLVRLIVTEAVSVINLGGFLGLLAAFASARFVASMLVGVGQHDPLVISGAFALMTTLGFLASSVPAFFASRIDLLTILREE
jgi:predicted permease